MSWNSEDLLQMQALIKSLRENRDKLANLRLTPGQKAVLAQRVARLDSELQRLREQKRGVLAKLRKEAKK